MLSCEEIQPDQTVALLPVGCVEQHGPVLPLETDSLLAEGCCKKLQKSLDFKTYVYPGIHYTTTQPNQDYPGTVSVDYDLFRAYLSSVCQGLLASGFRAVVIVNSHGSVVPAIKEVAFGLVHQQFRQKKQKVTPVLAVNVFDCDHLITAEFGQSPGRHAEWKEMLLVYGLLGSSYFGPERLSRLREFANTGEFEIRFPAVLGIPMELRSNRGVVGLPLPPGEDFEAQADRIWKITVDYLTEHISQALTGFEHQFSRVLG